MSFGGPLQVPSFTAMIMVAALRLIMNGVAPESTEDRSFLCRGSMFVFVASASASY